MGPTRIRCKIAFSIFALGALCPPVWAQETAADATLAPFTLSAKYEVDWSGIPIGRINITASEGATGYRMVVDTKTSGIAQLFSDERTEASVEGIGGLGTPYLPRRYASAPQKNGKGQRTTITYDEAGKILSLERLPGDDPNWRPVVPRDQANTATDPITAAFALRRRLHEALATGQTSAAVRTYDGARLATMRATIVQPRTLTVMDQPMAVVDTRITRTPITGYTPKEIKKFEKGDPEIHLYFTRDAEMLPVKITVESGFGPVHARMIKRN